MSERVNRPRERRQPTPGPIGFVRPGDVLPRLKEAHIETGRIKLVHRHFPLNRIAPMASVPAECRFRACLAYDRLSTAIVQDPRTDQQRHDVNSTPTPSIGNTILRSGRDYDEIEKATDGAEGR